LSCLSEANHSPTSVTLHDVAKAAGVSISTASRALSGRQPVSPELTRAVLAASERVGYRVNAVARSLRAQTTATVGMVVPVISNPCFPRLVEAVERELSVRGLALLLCDSQNDPRIEASRIEALLDRRVDGVLFIPCDSDLSSTTLLRVHKRVAMVQVHRFVTGADIDFVGSDDAMGIAMVVRHLRDTGRSTFAFVGGQANDSVARLRLDAYRRAAGAIDVNSRHCVLLGDSSDNWGRAAANRLIAAGGLPDAILCDADVVALGVTSVFTDREIRVPEDVAVTGFDDISFASMSSPALTTLRQPVDTIGAVAVGMLADKISNSSTGRNHRLIAPELVVRGSTLVESRTIDERH
jgi:LacI family transcriptional regulator